MRIAVTEIAKKVDENHAAYVNKNTDKESGDELNQSIYQCSNAEEIFLLCEKHADKLNHVNISTAMNRLAKFLGCFSETRPKDNARLTARQEKTCTLIFNHAVSNASQFDSQSLSTLIWALASLNMPSAGLQEGMGVITQRVIATASCFKPLDLSDLMWGLAMLELPAERLLVKAVSDRAVKVIHEFNARQLSRLMWAIAKLKVNICIELAQAVSRRAVDTIRDFKPVHMSQLMWAFAKLDYFPGNELARAMLHHASSNLDGFLRQCHTSSNFLWAIDHLGIKPDPRLADALSAGLGTTAPEIPPCRTLPEPEAVSTKVAEQSQLADRVQPAGHLCGVHEGRPSASPVQGAQRSSDEPRNQGGEPGRLPSQFSACSEETLILSKRKRDYADDNMVWSGKIRRENAEATDPPKAIQEFQTAQNRNACVGTEKLKRPAEPVDTGDAFTV
jgi:hypothetical protein